MATGEQTGTNASPQISGNGTSVLVTATGSTTARTLAARAADQVNVKDFGATGNGATDDTAAIQAAIDAALPGGAPASHIRYASKAVRVPSGTYRITATLRVWSAVGFKLLGDGPQNTRFLVDGALATALDLNGVGLSTFSGFSIYSLDGGVGGDTFDVGIKYRWKVSEALFPSTQNHFFDIHITNAYFKVGVQVGSDLSESASGQEDQTHWFGLRVAGARLQRPGDAGTWWQEGVRVGSGVFGNNLIHDFHGTTVSGCKYGVRGMAGEAAFYGGNNQSNEVDWRFDGLASRYWYVNGFRSESSGRMVEVNGGVGNLTNATFENVEWKVDTAYANADRRVIRWEYGGTLSLRQISFTGSEGAAYRPKIYFSGSTLLIDGMTVGSDGDPIDFLEVPVGGTAGSAQVRGLYFMSNSTGGVRDDSLAGLQFFNQRSKIGWRIGPGAADVTVERTNVGAGAGGLLLTAPGGASLPYVVTTDTTGGRAAISIPIPQAIAFGANAGHRLYGVSSPDGVQSAGAFSAVQISANAASGSSAFNMNSGATFDVGGGPTLRAGAGTPEGAITASPGSLYLRTDGAAGTSLYVKETGVGNTGWVAK